MVSSASDSVIAYDSDGNYRRTFFTVDATETIRGLEYLSSTKELLIVVDGNDRVVAKSIVTGIERTLISNTNYAGTLGGIMQLSGGDLLLTETDNVERFTTGGIRVVTGAWPKALQTGGRGISKLGTGFVHCSTTLDVVRTYDSTGTQLATASSGIAATTDAFDCLGLADGKVVVVWNGTTDTVQVRSSTLATVSSSFADQAYLPNPQGLAQASNGNLFVSDGTNNWIVEMTLSGVFVRVLGQGLLNVPTYMKVIP